MRIISLSLTNIGPFRDQTINLYFREWSYLIKAPIGSGKSFVFFDGPTFALYKKSKRPMLNMHSKTGHVICTFEVEGQVYIIQREITKTKTGESIKSKLYTLDQEATKLYTQQELFTLSDVSPTSIESSAIVIDFKNEIDLQQTLNSLLPPMEVFLGTQMLMQDTPNIFELEPKDRLEIFKNVFNLLGIDEAKEKIAERKRELAAMIKARADTSAYDQKIKQSITLLISQRDSISQMIKNYKSWGIISGSIIWEQTLHEWKLLQDKLTIDLLSLPSEPIMIEELLHDIEKLQWDTITFQTQQKHLQEQIATKVREIETLQTQTHQLQKEQQHYQTQIDSYDPQQLEDITKQIKALQEKREVLQNTIDQTHITELIKNLSTIHHNDQILMDIIDRARLDYRQESKRTLVSLQRLLNELKNLAKDYTHQLSLQEQAKANHHMQQQNLSEQLQKAELRIQSFQKDIEGQKLFRCEKIQDNCPYIDLINASTFKKLTDQLHILINDRDHIQKDIKKLNSEGQTITQDVQAQLQSLKDFFVQIRWKEIDESVIQYQEYDRQSQTLQSQRLLLQDKVQQLSSLKDSIIRIDSTLRSLEQQQWILQQQQLWFTENLSQLQQKIVLLPEHTTLSRDKEVILDYRTTIDRLSQIISDFKTSQLELKKLKEDEKIVSDLYQIFSRELLLIVVQRNLPQLQDLMNSYLAQVVDYQLQMDIDKKSANSESIDLFVTITDDKWPREVKSLSGWQKVILKLVWMMAVATVMRSKMLFLDETINNLDGDTIAKVAELLKNFVEGKGKAFMLYVVTHSHQIQEMNIWDEVIELRGAA